VYGDKCSNLKINGNTAIGSSYAGFGAPAIDCTDSNGFSFINNIAHSINGDGGVFFIDSNRP
jgi:hypothetical protein